MNYVDFTNGLLENNLRLIGCFRLQVSSGMFVAVVYSNCNSFFLGKVLNTKDGILSISFLEEIDGKSHVFAWPPQATVETVDAEQVLITGLEAKEAADTNRLTFPRIMEVKAAFPQCKEALVLLRKIVA